MVLSSDDTKAYISTGESGLQIMNISDPATPVIVASIDTPEYVNDIALSSNDTKLFILSGLGLDVFDVTNPTTPTLIAHINISSNARYLTLSADGTKAFITGDYGFGLYILDVSGF